MSGSETVVRLTRPQTHAELTLEALRSEIDAHDDQILALLERRMAVAARVRAFKDEGRTLNLKPDREARVIARLLDRADPGARRLVEAVWREVLSAGLAAQGAVTVAVWPGRRGELREAARTRFGACAAYREAADPAEALLAARESDTVAVLALDAEPWWADLPQDLWAFDAVSTRSGPVALAVGRIDPLSLAHGRVLRVSCGGDADPGAARPRLLAAAEGLRLYAAPDRGEALDRASGAIGRLGPA